MGRRPDPAGVRAQKKPVRSTREPQATESEVLEPVGGAKTPKFLTGAALEIWQEQAPVLRAQNMLKALDEPAFARYCRNFADWIKLRGELDVEGFTYEADTTNGGKLRRGDPRFMIADRIERQLSEGEDRFGLNPTSRQRLIMSRLGQQGQLPLDKPGGDSPPPSAATRSPIGMLNNKLN